MARTKQTSRKQSFPAPQKAIPKRVFEEEEDSEDDEMEESPIPQRHYGA